MVEDGRGRVAHVEEEVEQPRVARLRAHAVGQLHGVAEGGEGAVHDADHLAYEDLRGGATEAIAAFAAPLAGHEAGVLERDQDALQELLRDGLLLRDLVDLHEPPRVRFRQVEEGLEGVEAAVGYLHCLSGR